VTVTCALHGSSGALGKSWSSTVAAIQAHATTAAAPAAAVPPDIAQGQCHRAEASATDRNAKVWPLPNCWQVVVAVLVLLWVKEPLVCAAIAVTKRQHTDQSQVSCSLVDEPAGASKAGTSLSMAQACPAQLPSPRKRQEQQDSMVHDIKQHINEPKRNTTSASSLRCGRCTAARSPLVSGYAG
jgi:hypothetical protein